MLAFILKNREKQNENALIFFAWSLNIYTIDHHQGTAELNSILLFDQQMCQSNFHKNKNLIN